MNLSKRLFFYAGIVLSGILSGNIAAQENTGALLDVYDIPPLPYSLETDEDIINITSPSIVRQKMFVDLDGVKNQGVKNVYRLLLKKNITWSGVFDVHENPITADYKLKIYDGLFSDYNVDFTTQKNEIILSDKLGYDPTNSQKIEYGIIRILNKILKKLTDTESPLGKSILYSEKKIRSSNKKIVLVDTHGYFKKVLVDNGKLNFYPRWSNLGDRFSFITLTKRGYTLRFFNLTTSKIRETQIYAPLMSGGSWSPDDTQFAVTISKDGNPDIFIFDSTTGKIIRRLTRLSSIETSASYSSKGNRIILTSNKSGRPQIYQYTDKSPILKRLTFAGKYNTEPHWNPTNAYFLYGTIIGGSMEIMLFDSDTSDVYRVTHDKKSSEQGRWSPDGRQIIFSKKFGSNLKIHLMNMDGSYPRRLTYSDDQYIESDPDWSNFPIFRYIQ